VTVKTAEGQGSSDVAVHQGAGTDKEVSELQCGGQHGAQK
jgi:hypothetical protein